MGIHDVPPTELILRVAEELKKNEAIQAPAWAPLVKTGSHKERAPQQEDWWHIRSAAILRKIFINGPIGTEKLRTQFGARKNRGVRPSKFVQAGGNHIRKILQQLEKAGLTKQSTKGVHKGRIIAPAGQSLLEKMSSEVAKKEGIALPKPQEKTKAKKEENGKQ